jgi:hypothetical protein
MGWLQQQSENEWSELLLVRLYNDDDDDDDDEDVVLLWKFYVKVL